VGARRHQAPASRHHLPLRSVHPAEGDALPGEVGVLAVLHLLHLAEHETGADRVLHRAHPHRRARVHAAEPLRQHPRHPARVPAARRPPGVSDQADPRGDARRDLRHLQRLRARRERAGEAGQRGVPGFREVSDPPAQLRRTRTASRR
jgi:hypothetical protein